MNNAQSKLKGCSSSFKESLLISPMSKHQITFTNIWLIFNGKYVLEETLFQMFLLNWKKHDIRIQPSQPIPQIQVTDPNKSSLQNILEVH